ncbi:hypothetical protein [Microbacterium testaceum]|uniref:hypothetical protein n=1 Tax=Microbacterium testaceum TaxID=2033 RepID=UPI0022E82D3E|nr:hypothetical protein [Microbacterium testaceum]
MPSIDEELAALRRRAYAPDGDIAADPAAMARLVELEERAAAASVPDARAAAVPAPTPAPDADAEAGPADPSAQGERPDELEPDAPAEPARHPRSRFRMPRPRRSTVVLLTAAALVVGCAVTALVVVQRVQTDPLQVGATQIARLAPDPDFPVPSSFARGVTGKVTAYEEFQGFRVVSYPSFETGEGASQCLTVWQPALLSEVGNGTSYDGRYLLFACGAGVFPASATLLLGADSPEKRNSDLPAGTALQFVYDAAADEVVVFEG